MDEERIERAMARIEAAARRIEAAAARPPAASLARSSNPAPDNDLAIRHEHLRREAWAALAELDTLIETIEA